MMHVGKRIKARAEVTLCRVELRVGREEKRKRHYGKVVVRVARDQKPKWRKEAVQSVFLWGGRNEKAYPSEMKRKKAGRD